MSDYEAVKKALAAGADPAMLCTTCPWDRNCLTPPSMTAMDIDEQIQQAALKDRQPGGPPPPEGEGRFPVATMMAALVYAGKDTAIQGCPVAVVRLRSGDGRKIAEMVKALMQSWEKS